MATYMVFVTSEHDVVIGMDVTGSRAFAEAKVAEYKNRGFDAWYEEI